MYGHKAVAWFEKSSRAADKSSWLLSIALGALITAAGFTLVFSGVEWFMPKFLHIASSRWAFLLPTVSILLILASGLLRYIRKRRTILRSAR
jgi:hypothetical protein